MIQLVKNQHYVPRGYLKNFAFGKKQHQIWRFSKINNKCVTNNINDIASENYFYELPQKMAEKFHREIGYSDFNSTESFLSRFEDTCLPIIKDILGACADFDNHRLNNIFIDSNYRGWLGTYLLIQNYRTKKFRKDIYNNELIKLNNNFKHPRGENNNSPISFQTTKEVADTISILCQQIKMLDLNELNTEVNALINFVWFIGVNDTDIPFLTSDNPIIQFYVNFNEEYVKTWSIPINSKYMLVILFSTLSGSLGYLNSTFQALTVDDILQYNKHQFDQSLEFIYCEKLIKDEYMKK